MKLPAQAEPTTLLKGIKGWQTSSGITVLRVHYTADPERCDELWLEDQLTGYPGGFDGRKWKREMEIDFSSYEGMPVYSLFDPTTAVATTTFDPSVPLWRGWDFGYRHPAVLWVQMFDNCLVIHREYYPTLNPVECPGMTADTLGKNVQALTEKWFPNADLHNIYDFGDPSGKRYTDTSEESVLDQLSHMGIHVEWERVGIVNRINFLRRFIEVPGRFRISPHCPLTIEAVSGAYHYPEDDSGGTFLEKPDKGAKSQSEPYVHLMDALEYIASVNMPTEYSDMPPLKKRRDYGDKLYNHAYEAVVADLKERRDVFGSPLPEELSGELRYYNENLEPIWSD